MKNLKRLLGLMIVLSLFTLGFQLAFAEQPANNAPVRVASLKGPTSMGMAKLIHDEQDQGTYEFTVAGTADEIVPLLAKGDMDIMLIPCNLSSVLYTRLEGELRMLAINTLGVLQVIENGSEVNSVADMKGKTLFSTGKGTTPEYALNYVLSKNGLNPESDMTIEYKSEAAEVAAAMNEGITQLAMLPQPYATAVLAQNPDLRVALSLSDEWDKVGDGSAMVTGVVVARKAFCDERPEAVQAFMQAYAASTDYVNQNPAEVAPWIEELGIAKAQIAEKAIPFCNIVCITGDEMKLKASGYLAALLAQDPASVGGKLPDEAFYAAP